MNWVFGVLKIDLFFFWGTFGLIDASVKWAEESMCGIFSRSTNTSASMMRVAGIYNLPHRALIRLVAEAAFRMCGVFLNERA